MNGQQIVDAVVNQGSFDLTSSGMQRTDVAGWCGEVYSCLVARSGWLRSVKTFATTIANQPEYDWPLDVVEAVELRDQAGRRYLPVTLDVMWDLVGDDMDVSVSSPSVYAVTYDAAGGTRNLRIFPVPVTAGLVLEGLCTLYPPAFTDGAGFTPVTPEDTHGSIIDGAIRVGRRRVEELDVPVVVDDVLGSEIALLRARRLAEVPPPQTIPIFRRPR